MITENPFKNRSTKTVHKKPCHWLSYQPLLSKVLTFMWYVLWKWRSKVKGGQRRPLLCQTPQSTPYQDPVNDTISLFYSASLLSFLIPKQYSSRTNASISTWQELFWEECCVTDCVQTLSKQKDQPNLPTGNFGKMTLFKDTFIWWCSDVLL